MAPTTWMVRCEGGALYNRFTDDGIIALGGPETQPDMSGCRTFEDVRDRLSPAWRGLSRQSLGYAAGVLNRFVCEMSEGDRVLTYNPSLREYRVGTVIGSYIYDTDRLAEKQHFRAVRWGETLSRDDLSQTVRNSLGSMMSAYRLTEEAASEIEALLNGETPAPVHDPQPDTRASAPVEPDLSMVKDLAEQALEMVKDRVARLSWDEMQDVLAGVLRAMGYKTRVSGPGPDRGRDVFASPDGLGLESPRIVAEVKHRSSTIGAPDLRGFIGGLQASDRGLYLSTGGFTREAYYEAERANVPVTLLDLDGLVRLLFENYDRADARLRTLIPLEVVLWPTD